ncbi:carboxypeptidase-like regulatory domain-containing protein [candidate division WOR-3 bacterium]|uniref:Carboxypeptidase-like regulatory domain-containing protein n=1 Tax=candidate division WOR-3 bacterium TaxID=2052148 RepID=A0A937XGX5_UNCW3|nr:carboxypeptidase-like regulatory domain-containing protein [candidate division WOR-3 bacterium]
MKYLVCVLLCAAAAFGSPDVLARVRDGETKLPLVGATVMSEGSDIMAVTDSSGQCLVVAAPRRGGALVASRQGYLDQALTGAWLAKPGQDTVVIDFLLCPKRPVEVGRVAASADSSVATTSAGAAAESPAAAESKRSDGGFGGAGSAAGQLATEARRTEGVEESRSPAGTASVEGTVSDAETGLPVPAARIAVEGTEMEAVSDSEGRYVLEYVSAGRHKLLVTCSGYANAYTVLRFVKDWVVTANLYLRKTASKPTSAK